MNFFFQLDQEIDANEYALYAYDSKLCSSIQVNVNDTGDTLTAKLSSFIEQFQYFEVVEFEINSQEHDEDESFDSEMYTEYPLSTTAPFILKALQNNARVFQNSSYFNFNNFQEDLEIVNTFLKVISISKSFQTIRIMSAVPFSNNLFDFFLSQTTLSLQPQLKTMNLLLTVLPENEQSQQQKNTLESNLESLTIEGNDFNLLEKNIDFFTNILSLNLVIISSGTSPQQNTSLKCLSQLRQLKELNIHSNLTQVKEKEILKIELNDIQSLITLNISGKLELHKSFCELRNMPNLSELSLKIINSSTYFNSILRNLKNLRKLEVLDMNSINKKTSISKSQPLDYGRFSDLETLKRNFIGPNIGAEIIIELNHISKLQSSLQNLSFDFYNVEISDNILRSIISLLSKNLSKTTIELIYLSLSPLQEVKLTNELLNFKDLSRLKINKINFKPKDINEQLNIETPLNFVELTLIEDLSQRQIDISIKNQMKQIESLLKNQNIKKKLEEIQYIEFSDYIDDDEDINPKQLLNKLFSLLLIPVNLKKIIIFMPISLSFVNRIFQQGITPDFISFQIDHLKEKELQEFKLKLNLAIKPMSIEIELAEQTKLSEKCYLIFSEIHNHLISLKFQETEDEEYEIDNFVSLAKSVFSQHSQYQITFGDMHNEHDKIDEDESLEDFDLQFNVITLLNLYSKDHQTEILKYIIFNQQINSLLSFNPKLIYSDLFID